MSFALALPAAAQTTTQSGVRGPNCPPPDTGGPPPKNWSCKTGNQQVTKPRPSDQPLGTASRCQPTQSPTLVANARELAAIVLKGYQDGVDPIFIARLRQPPGKFLIAASGISFLARPGQTTHIFEGLNASLDLADNYGRAMERALRAYTGTGTPGISGNLIMAGHSLGGMTMQHLAADPEFKAGFNPTLLITFGSPMILPKDPPDVRIIRFALIRDPIISASIRSWSGLRPGRNQIPLSYDGIPLVPESSRLNPIDLMNYYHNSYHQSEDLEDYNPFGQRIVGQEQNRPMVIDAATAQRCDAAFI